VQGSALYTVKLNVSAMNIPAIYLLAFHFQWLNQIVYQCLWYNAHSINVQISKLYKDGISSGHSR
jgi:hypothetical protein